MSIVLFSLWCFTFLKDIMHSVNGNEYSHVGTLIIVFYLAALVSINVKYISYLRILDNIIFIIAFTSIVIYIFIYFNPGIVWKLPDYTYYHTNHKTLFIYNVLTVENNIVFRNTGIAHEPGAFQFLLLIGLYCHIFTQKNNISIIRVATYGLSIFLTYSTAGFFFAFASFIYIFLKLIKKRKLLAPIIIVIVSIMSLPHIKQQYNYHLENKLIESTSFEYRFTPLKNTIQLIKDYPFGLGNTLYDKYLESKNIGGFESISMIVNRYGVLSLLFILALYFTVFIKQPILGLSLFSMLISQSLWYVPLVWFLIIGTLNYDLKRAYKKQAL